MSGMILLEGGAEFGGAMAEADRRAIQLAGGLDAPICILPTAAAPDHNDQRAGNNGLRWFTKLGARQVQVMPILDHASANRAELAQAVRTYRLIYMLGGFPAYLEQTLRDSLVWEAMLEAQRNGAVLGGSSAGAMVLCQHYYDPASDSLQAGLNLLPGTCLIPHHNRVCKGWGGALPAALPGVTLIGIDEQTGLINDQPDGGWTVYGKGKVTCYKNNQINMYTASESFIIDN